MRATLRRLGIGTLAYRLFHAPHAAVRRSIAAGGPIEQWRTATGRAAMARAVHSLPVPAGTGRPVELHLLTGHRFWYQTAFCLWTFATQSGRPIAPLLYDDGSLTPVEMSALARLFPAQRVIRQNETLARLERYLPAARFPVLRERWLAYPNIRKLIDVHLGSNGWKLVLDSDLLFFSRPHFLLRWLDSPLVPLHAVDAETSYGYSGDTLRHVVPAPIPDRLNVGLCGLCSEELDWDWLEATCQTLISREGTHYYLEQALIALLLAGRECAVAPEEDYITLPRPPEVERCEAVMHHYVAGSKRWYFRENWRRAIVSAR